MDEYEVRITRQAREHLREIRRYIECKLQSPLAAKNILLAIRNKIQSLARMPRRVHLTPEQPWHDSGVRRDRVNNYYLYFWIDEDNKKVQVIGVIYVRREQSKQLEQLDME